MWIKVIRMRYQLPIYNKTGGLYMPYRNGTYIAFDGQGTADPTESDLKYLGILRSWNKNQNNILNFYDSHLKTYRVLDSSSRKTLEARLLERMRKSKNMLIILSEDTNYDRGMLNYEIEKAVDYYRLPLIIAYTGCEYLVNAQKYSERWPKALRIRIENGSAKAIHIAFKEKAIMTAITRFSVHSVGENVLRSSLCVFSSQTYMSWGYLDIESLTE